ncbi:MAG: SDR family NAD(P)-dependent oxidoreductase [bacterium]|nr:SDR family NAD(P)-dependent oxidoreductase [bacterium]
MNDRTGMDASGVAIIGMACRFPGAETIDRFWENLCKGVESISELSDAELLAAGADPELVRQPNYVKARGVVPNADCFDAAFFGYSPREAEVMDPQHRLFLECAWEALENAGYIERDAGMRVGVFAGGGLNSYLFRGILKNPTVLRNVDHFQVFIGNDKDFIPTRVSYKLDLHGPSVHVSTACSTSLTAVHQACQSLLDYQSDLALAGAVSVQFPQQEGYLFREGAISSPDGHCRPFDAAARGTVPGGGAGAVILKRLDEAIRDRDAIVAVIRGSAINNDGIDKAGYTAPSVEGQAEVILEAQLNAGVSPDSITYIEAHGTATELGDPIEIAALTQAFRTETSRRGYCAIGSVKSNLGHLDAAAGMAGLIKTALALRHKRIPPSLHYQSPNPAIDFSSSPFYVNSTLSPWLDGDAPRRAGVSAFGIGGSNAHVVLEEAPQPECTSTLRPCQLIALSAKTDSALNAAAQHFSLFFEEHPSTSLADAAYTLSLGRKQFAWRRFVVCGSADEAVSALRVENPACSNRGDVSNPSIVFLFPGQGAQYPGMGRELYETEPDFQSVIDYCSERLQTALGEDLREILFPSEEALPEQALRINQTGFAQPALFAVEYAVAKLWMAWGVQPAAMIGHSLGEYVAACLAGVFDLDDALDLVAYRGRIMQQTAPGAMLAIRTPYVELEPLPPGVSLAAVNAADSCVVSGDRDAIAALELDLQSRSVHYRRLNTSHAFHSSMMDPILSEWRERLCSISLNPPGIPYLSNLTGEWIDARLAADPDYWVNHLRNTVRFDNGLSNLLKNDAHVFLETGPGHTLSSLVKRHPAKKDRASVVASMPQAGEEIGESRTLMTALGSMWLTGAAIDWRAVYAHESRGRISLPAYAFERVRHCVSLKPAGVSQPEMAPQKEADVSQWLYAPTWKQAPLPRYSRNKLDGAWLIFADETGLSDAIQSRLTGRRMVVLRQGDEFQCVSPAEFIIRPDCDDHYRRVFQSLSDESSKRCHVIHAWNVCKRTPDWRLDEWTTQRRNGYASLLCLAQALGDDPMFDEVGLIVASTGLFAVMGDEPLSPGMGGVVGAIKTIPQEYPFIQCRCVDLPVVRDLERSARRLVDECLTSVNDSLVAYRGAFRWIQTLEPAPLPLAESSPVREGGVYLITGGLGGIGLELAERFARDSKARLVLTARSEFPPRSQWPDIARASSHSASSLAPLKTLTSWRAELSSIRDRLVDEFDIQRIDRHSGLRESFNALCAACIVEYLQSIGLTISPGISFTRNEIIQRGRVIEPFDKLIDCFLSFLCGDGLLAEKEGVFVVVAKGDLSSTAQLEKLKRNHPGFAPLAELLKQCASHYREALSGEIDAISVLYPDGSRNLMAEADRRTIEHIDARVYRTLLKEFLARRLKEAPNRHWRILEIGGGTGMLTGELLPVLREANVEYHFTDIGKSFVLNAQKNARERGFDFFRFGVLDVTHDPVSQGFEEGFFDIVLAMDVIHATPDITASLANIRKLVAPGGVTALLESIHTPRWSDMIFGLAKGWWYYRDAHRRRPYSPLLELDSWEAAFRECGFDSVLTFPCGEERRMDCDSSLILAGVELIDTSSSLSVSTGVSEDVADKVQRLERILHQGADIEVIQADVSNEADVKRVIESAVQRFGPINGVIHAAGVDAKAAIQNRRADEETPEFAPKLAGAYWLNELLDSNELDFFVLCSSLSAISGGAGQIGYCAANAELDAFAHACAINSGARIISIDWDRWQSVGMARDYERWLESKTGEPLSGGMTVDQGMDVFMRIVAHAASSQIVVQMKQNAPTLAISSRRSGNAMPEAEQSQNIQPANGSEEGWSDSQALVARVFRETLGVSSVSREDDFYQLGGDSLIALQVVSRLREELAVNLSVKTVFEKPAVAALADYLDTVLWARNAADPAVVAGDDADHDEGVL